MATKSIKLNDKEMELLEKKKSETGYSDSKILKLGLYEPCLDKKALFNQIMTLSNSIEKIEKEKGVDLDHVREEVMNLCLMLN